ncbi:MAG: ABC transporter permease [Acidimicrobiia bacterium]
MNTLKPNGDRRRINWNAVLIEGRALVALAIIIAIFAILSGNYLKPDNLIIMTRHVAINAIVAMGMLLTILHGGIDLSVGSTVGLAGVVAGYLLSGWDLPMTDTVAYPAAWVVILIALGVGAIVGLVNGWLVARLNLAPFIATLGMLYVARGLALVVSNGLTFTKLLGDKALGNTGFLTVLAGRPFGIPAPVWVMILVAIILSYLLTRTPFGRWLYSVGGNERAAQLSGVPFRKVKTRVYVISGVCAAMVGLLLTADLRAATPRSGEFYELNAIAAVVIGGTALSGGRGTIRGTLIGAFVIGFLVDGLVLVGVSVFWQQVIKGAVIILAVAVDQIQQMISKRRASDRAARPPGSSTPVSPDLGEVVGV